MSELRIALLNAARSAAETRRNFERELDAELVEFNCPDGELPSSFAFDACVVTGSEASVYWDEPWIGRLKEWVGDAVSAGVPFLGVCYGHQLLADVLGGQVERMGEYEIGYRTIRHDGENPLLDGVDEEFTAFTTHSDRVRRAPPGARVFAHNDYGIHGFRKGRVLTVQFHPEYDMEMARSVTKGKDIDQAKIDAVLAGITEENYRAAREAKQLFDNFLAFVERVRADRAAVESLSVDR
ncbi:type 1 glutamine amidotransferase [Halapricum desulfuricans]|uniref:GMP synthase - Glutamine amidotransferase domain n=1 Tax=Halapricum desulfuricans TaxID=2841257 RepID=A0A897NCM1_9EURY|nr:type 1 glutamine amidotransferase [Halapricum desulfuricans]QSG08729.1 GMP synthase - Glutamine amidotransferase domain [Halapricum desulfuricans]